MPVDVSQGTRHETFIDDIIKILFCLSVIYALESIPTPYFQSPIICTNRVADAGPCEKRPTTAILNLAYWCDVC